MTSTSLAASRQLLIGEVLKRAVYRTPNREACVDRHRRLTYTQLGGRVTQLAGWLQARGVGPNDKVAYLLKNGIAFVEVFYAVSLTGSVGVPINFRLNPREIAYILQNSDSKLLVVDAELYEAVQGIRRDLPVLRDVVVVEDHPESGVHRMPDSIPYESVFREPVQFRPAEEPSDEDDAVIVYTSGTTGRPKGAVLSHKNLVQNSMNVVWEMSLSAHSKQLTVAPLFHIAAMSTVVTSCLVNGTTVIHREFVPVQILETIDREKIDNMFLVPAMWNFLLQVYTPDSYDVSSMKTCVTGGAICPLELKKAIMKSFPNAGIYDAFGQTETSPVVTCLHAEDALRKTTSVGRAVINVELRVVDEFMNDVPVGEIGEAVYRGPTVMKEYYKNPSATEDAFHGGWFHSGDLVKMDEEGFVYIVDRKKDMIISGGENIYPAEIEEVLYAHPAILEAAVIGVPDADWGEKVKAFVVVKPGAQLTAEEVVAHCTARLASYKKPKSVEFVEALPRNAAGKVLKRVLRSPGEQVL